MKIDELDMENFVTLTLGAIYLFLLFCFVSPKQILLANSTDDNKGKDSLAGKVISQSLGCMACHSLDGSEGVGPSWKGIAGTTRELDSGEKIVADHFYLEESIIQPNSKVLLNYPAIMPSYDLMHRELDEIVEFIESLN